MWLFRRDENNMLSSECMFRVRVGILCNFECVSGD